MGDTSIEWTDRSWNPTRGCSRVSPGCGGANGLGGCYAEKIAARFSDEGQRFHGFAKRSEKRGLAQWTGHVALLPEKLAEPLRWRKPRRIFVNSMSDLFHDRLTNEEIAAAFGVMAATPQHTYQVLTKRAERLPDWYAWAAAQRRYGGVESDPAEVMRAIGVDRYRLPGEKMMTGDVEWPLPNVWIGVSVEDQERAYERIPPLLKVPAAVRFLSCEPLLEHVDVQRWLGDAWVRPHAEGGGISWLIVGGESGHKARPFALNWARSLVAQCKSTGCACFVKQMGARPTDVIRQHDDAGAPLPLAPEGTPIKLVDSHGGDPEEWPADLRVREFPRPG